MKPDTAALTAATSPAAAPRRAANGCIVTGLPGAAAYGITPGAAFAASILIRSL